VLFAQKDPAMKGFRFELARKQSDGLFEYIYYYPQRRFFDKAWSQWYYFRILKSFLQQLKQEHGDPSLVHVNIVWRAAAWALFMFNKYQWPFVITENSTEYQDNARDNIRSMGILRQKITANAFKKCSLFIPVSAQLGNKIRELYGDIPFRVVPNTVDTSIFHYEPREKTNKVFRILHVSTMGYQKNIDGIIRVLENLAESQVIFEVILAGPVSNEVKEMVSNQPWLSKLSTFTGAITYPEVAELMKSSDCLLLFSRYENLPCVILEAFCCGLPVVTTNVGGIPEIVHKSNGILVNDGDEAGLYQALKSLVSKSTFFDNQEIAVNASRLYNYDAVGKSFLNIYKEFFPGRF
jgi:glycosyltransferase involved in cell wall biosynthesis